jgi:hypothetical protein
VFTLLLEIVWAMQTLGFEEYQNLLKFYPQKSREAEEWCYCCFMYGVAGTLQCMSRRCWWIYLVRNACCSLGILNSA